MNVAGQMGPFATCLHYSIGRLPKYAIIIQQQALPVQKSVFSTNFERPAISFRQLKWCLRKKQRTNRICSNKKYKCKGR